MHLKTKYSCFGTNNEFLLEKKHAKPSVCYIHSSQKHFHNSESSSRQPSTPKGAT